MKRISIVLALAGLVVAGTMYGFTLYGGSGQELDEGILGVSDCTFQGNVIGSSQDPEHENSCLVSFQVWHLDKDDEDPDCCTHYLPDWIDLYIKPSGGDYRAYEMTQGTGGYSEEKGCYYHTYNVTKSLTKETEYTYYFQCPTVGCRDPDGIATYDTGPIDCE